MPDPKPIILLVEDEDELRLSMRDFLKRRGYQVLVASEGVGAIKVLLDYTVDLVITDYRMNLLGGDYWIRFLKRFCPDVRVLVTSGFLRPEFTIPFEVLLKPFEYKDLQNRIDSMLKPALTSVSPIG
jgi:DNA-binding response OmpR family regulator